MTSRELRKERRRQEHKARKEEYKLQKQSGAAPSLEDTSATRPESIRLRVPPPDHSDSEFSPEFIAYANSVGGRTARKAGFDPQTGRRLAPESSAPEPVAPVPPPIPQTPRAQQNRANAQLSTGPRTASGKAASSKNAVRHGLASGRFALLDWERFEDFEELLANLHAEHQPATQTEVLLVETMAQHFWLSQRALRLQHLCFHPKTPMCDEPKEMALYIRYGATHDRAFHQCLVQLQKLRVEQRKVENEFVSQKRQQAAETRKIELHEAKLRALSVKQTAQKPKTAAKPSPAKCSDTAPTVGEPSKVFSAPRTDNESLIWTAHEAA